MKSAAQHGMADANAGAWKNRSRRLGSSFKSVLFKGLSDTVNRHLHEWHVRTVRDAVAYSGGERLLDVGCGYGRISLPLIEQFPDMDITGMDISDHYVAMYRENTGKPAITGTLEQLDPSREQFDRIICVTVLMYVPPEETGAAVSRLLQCLKPGGRLILVENDRSGLPFQTAGGLLTLIRKIRNRDADSTGGRVFTTRELRSAVNAAGGGVVTERRMPVTSMLLLALVACDMVLPGFAVKVLFGLLSRADRLLGSMKLPSMYVAYTVQENT